MKRLIIIFLALMLISSVCFSAMIIQKFGGGGAPAETMTIFLDTNDIVNLNANDEILF